MIEDQLQRVKRLLDKVTYKPGWTLNAGAIPAGEDDPLDTGDYGDIVLNVTMVADDAIWDRKKVTVYFQKIIDMGALRRMDDRKVLDYFIFGAIKELEEHECNEWFKFDGICVRDPHPEQKGVA